MAYHRNETATRLLAHAYGQKATVALPTQRTASTQTGEFPAGVKDVLTRLVDIYAEWQPGGPIHWCFLVGGPGNGKSEALRALAETLRVSLPARASGDPAPRTVPEQWPDTGLPVVPGLEIAFINDASIPRPESLLAGGATSLFKDVTDGLGRLEAGRVPVVLFGNVNRGILVEELAACDRGTNSETSTNARLAVGVLKWLAKPHERSASGQDHITVSVPSEPATRYYAQIVIPPQESRTQALVVHALFLDTLSLVEPSPGDNRSIDFSSDPPVPARYSPLGGLEPGQGTRFDTVAGERTRHWTQVSLWQEGGCASPQGSVCDAYPRCPFAQNATWLRQPALLESFLGLLRSVEVVAGRRLTYRDLLAHLSLAVLGVPEEDWLEGVHPCQWVESLDRESQPSSLASLVHHRIYVNLFPRPSSDGWKKISGSAGSGGTVYREVRQRFVEGDETEGTPFQISFHKVDPALDADSWDGLRGRIIDICEASDVEVPAVQLSRLAELVPDAHSELELAVDQVTSSEVARELTATAKASSDRVRLLRKWRAVLLLRQAGLATGNFSFRGTVVAWLREQRIALNELPGSALQVGLGNLILPKIPLTGRQDHILILPFRPRTYALNALPPPETVFAAIPHGDLKIAMLADGDKLLAELLMVGIRSVAPIAEVVVDFSIAREGVLRSTGDTAGFTEIGYAAFARIERARAALVGRKRAESLPLYVVGSAGDLVRVEMNPSRSPLLRALDVG